MNFERISPNNYIPYKEITYNFKISSDSNLTLLEKHESLYAKIFEEAKSLENPTISIPRSLLDFFEMSRTRCFCPTMPWDNCKGKFPWGSFYNPPNTYNVYLDDLLPDNKIEISSKTEKTILTVIFEE